MAPYLAVAIQSAIEAAYADPEAIWRNLRRAEQQLDSVVDAVKLTTRGRGPKLALFPEAFLHGFGSLPRRSQAECLRMATPIPGPVTERLSRKAREHELYLAGTIFEVDDEYPGHYFNTGFIIDPSGEVILKYRKISTATNIETSSNPGDVLGRYGNDPKKLFPVVETEIGRLAMFICYDRRFPEPSRIAALNGAEVLLHPTGAGGGLAGSVNAVEWWRMILRVRAFENNAYVIGSQWAYSPDSELVGANGHSLIVDFNGNVLSEVDGDREGYTIAAIDPEAVRARRQPGASFLMEIHTPIYAEAYARASSWPTDVNGYRETMPRDLYEKHEVTCRVYEQLCAKGVLKKPAGGRAAAGLNRS